LRIGEHAPEELAKWRLPAVKVDNKHFELASRAWRAFGAPTPQDWFELSKQDLNVLPRLRQAVLELLEELPWRATGIGATEMQILEFIAEGGLRPGDILLVFLAMRDEPNDAYLGTGRSGNCSTDLLDALSRPFTASMRDRSRLKCTTIESVASDTIRASYGSLRSAGRSWDGKTTSAVTIRSTAGGAAPN
jgi:hypothetical protein